MRLSFENDRFGGQYLILHTEDECANLTVKLDDLADLDRFVCSFREEPFFMSAVCGDHIEMIPSETQWLGIRHRDGSFSLWYSMAFEIYRTSFSGRPDGLYATALSGEEKLTASAFCAAYRIGGKNYYQLLKQAAVSLKERFGTFRLRDEKPYPSFAEYLGWCTWDAFYDSVTEEDVLRGLESFREGGFVPRMLLLDDGWQTTSDQKLSRGRWKLSDFKPNAKFGRSLQRLIKTAKEHYGVRQFLVWHAVGGYWGGVDPASDIMKKYQPVFSRARHTEELQQVNPARCESEDFEFGLIDPAAAEVFYDDYHAALQAQGVDGVKVDVQAALEGHSEGRGGRIAMVKRFRQALEASARKHFNGNLLHCMSCSNDLIYHSTDSNLTRSSGDFTPADPSSHSAHIYLNAANSLWMKEFTVCDWDMFQTGHPRGAYHAAARAICGGPVYVSDRVGEHDFALIKALTDAKGKILRTMETAVPTPDCLFRDPRQDQKPYKIVSRNESGFVIGAFAFGDRAEETTVSAEDLPETVPEKLAVYRYKAGDKKLLKRGETFCQTLKNGEFELITLAPVREGFALIGLTEKMNSGGGTEHIRYTGRGISFVVKDEGKLLIYTEKKLKSIRHDGALLAFAKEATGFLTLQIPHAGQLEIEEEELNG